MWAKPVSSTSLSLPLAAAKSRKLFAGPSQTQR
jgi:hypothetical protein